MEIGEQAQSSHVRVMLWFFFFFQPLFSFHLSFYIAYLLSNFWPHAYFLFHFSISFLCVGKMLWSLRKNSFLSIYYYFFSKNINTSFSVGRLLSLVRFISMISSTKINKFSPWVRAFQPHTIVTVIGRCCCYCCCRF